MTLPDSEQRDMGFYVALAQTGFELVIPAIIGLFLDSWLGLIPWLTIAGTVLGFVGGLTHMVLMLNKHDREERERRDKPGKSA